MSITFTEDDLILFIYNEATDQVSNDIKSALLTDKALQEKHKFLVATINRLDNSHFNPHDTSLKIIMEESALSQREEIY